MTGVNGNTENEKHDLQNIYLTLKTTLFKLIRRTGDESIVTPEGHGIGSVNLESEMKCGFLPHTSVTLQIAQRR